MVAAVEVSVDIAATPQRLWEVLADVERWPTWTASMRRVELLDDRPFGPGSRARVEQPRMRPLTWTVTAFEPDRVLTWESTAPGVRTVAVHLVEPLGTGSRLTLVVTHGGPLAPLVRLLTGRQTARYVRMEAAGHRRAAESDS
jgi:uncharacterized membrane protein